MWYFGRVATAVAVAIRTTAAAALAPPQVRPGKREFDPRRVVRHGVDANAIGYGVGPCADAPGHRAPVAAYRGE